MKRSTRKKKLIDEFDSSENHKLTQLKIESALINHYDISLLAKSLIKFGIMGERHPDLK